MWGQVLHPFGAWSQDLPLHSRPLHDLSSYSPALQCFAPLQVVEVQLPLLYSRQRSEAPLRRAGPPQRTLLLSDGTIAHNALFVTNLLEGYRASNCRTDPKSYPYTTLIQRSSQTVFQSHHELPKPKHTNETIKILSRGSDLNLCNHSQCRVPSQIKTWCVCVWVYTARINERSPLELKNMTRQFTSDQRTYFPLSSLSGSV